MSEEIAWLAGFWEGEGSIWANIVRGNKRRIRWSLTQKDDSEFSLLKAKAILVAYDIPENKIGIYSQGKRDAKELAITNYESIERIIILTWNYLSPKRKGQAQEAFCVYCEDFVPVNGPNKGGPIAKDVWSDICTYPIKDTFPWRGEINE